jgi:hypothetical protein
VRSPPRPDVVQFPGWGNLSVTGFHRVRGVRLVVGEHDQALPRGVVAPGTGVVRVAELVVRGVEEPSEHHRVWHAGELPLRVPLRSGGRQLTGGAVVRLVVGGGGGVPSRWDAAAGTALAHHCLNAGGMRHCGATQAEGEPRPGNRTPPVGAVAVSLAIASCCEVTRAARRRSVHACRER